jgi:shikimate kinase / 3-dehydroquinate synthase
MHGSLFLTGFMASGKSTVGRELAGRAGVPFVDLDARIAETAGKSVAEIFKTHGESHFRQLEREAVQSLLRDSAPQVIALGGGALLQRALRLDVLEHATLVCLRAKLSTLRERAAKDGPTRPLLQTAADVELLFEQREAGYAEAHAVFDVDSRSPAELAERALELWQRRPIAVAGGLQSYAVDVSLGGAPESVAKALGKPSQVLTIIDGNVEQHYGDAYREAFARAGLKETRYVLTPGEAYKNPQTLCAIWEHAQRQRVDRKAKVVGIGGGVTTDVAGFAAATWQRGLPWVSVPTTMLGMVDASVGGKTAVDLGEAKNCIGAFWQPDHVVCDVQHLLTESRRGFNSGLAEVVKTALLGDAPLFETLCDAQLGLAPDQQTQVSEVVRRCVRVKASVVSRDPKEQGLRAALNLGHTVGHAVEACDGYGKLTHGEAVSLGLVAALKIGVHLGVTEPSLLPRVTQLLTRLNLPTDLSTQPLTRAAEVLGHDKKRAGGSVKFVLCVKPGEFIFRDIPLPELQDLTVRLATL